MKKVGLIGGLSWQSTVDYYRIINEESNNRLGNKSTVESIIFSTDLERKYNLVTSGQLDTLAQEFIEIAQSLEKAGSDVIVMCTNTMHTVFNEIQANVNVPMIHIVDATGQAIKDAGIDKVALLGTTFTMTQPFYIKKLKDDFGIDTVVPKPEQMDEIMRVIEEELTFNIIKDSSREYFVNVINELKEQGAKGVILGCTEIQMLIKQKDSPVPVFDSTELHALAALNYAMAE
ncbi:MAG: aspartate/glutamate racemase family protein [Oscillospiraceae bacterium]|nr:aspartate/glutamate racemase family protein [Oscillospiraceae bacterium]